MKSQHGTPKEWVLLKCLQQMNSDEYIIGYYWRLSSLGFEVICTVWGSCAMSCSLQPLAPGFGGAAEHATRHIKGPRPLRLLLYIEPSQFPG